MTEKEKLDLFIKTWYERNPVHENNADTGEDMFWKTAMMVSNDFQQRLEAGQNETLVMRQSQAVDKLRGQLQNCVNHLHNAKRKVGRGYDDTLDDVIDKANKTLYDTLDA